MGSGQNRDSDGGAEGHEPIGEAEIDPKPQPEPELESESSEFDAMDTTSWSGSAPPVLIEDEEETVVAAPAPQPEPDPESEPEPEPAVGVEQETDALEDVVGEPHRAAEADPEPVTVPPGASPEPTDEGPTLLSVPGAVVSAASEEAAEAPSEAAALSASLGVAAIRPDEAETKIGQLTEDATKPRTMAPSASLSPILLERIEPSMGRGERIRLDVRQWQVRLGRAEENEVRLYTASASREHALIAGNEEGQWILTPSAGKSVFVDGELISEPMELEVGMNLVLGKDQLRCVIEGLDRRDGEARTATEAFEGQGAGIAGMLRAAGPIGMGVLILGVLSLVAVAFWLGA